MQYAECRRRVLLLACLFSPSAVAHVFLRSGRLPSAPMLRSDPVRRPIVCTGSRATVVGGGIAGLSVAFELASRGWSVRVICRDRSESATLSAGGMLAPQAERLDEGPLLQLCLRARAHFQPWLRDVEGKAGANAGLVARGGFIAPAYAGDAVERWTPPAAAGPSSWLEGDMLRNIEPSLSQSCVGGWWYPEEASVDPRALLPALVSACEASGVEILDGVDVTGMQLEQGGKRARALRLASGDEMAATNVVLCTGAWLRTLLPVPCSPLKGQMLCLSPADSASCTGEPALLRTVFSERCYIIPRQDGRIVIGATQEPEAGFCTRPTAAGVSTLLAAAIELVPSLASYTLDEAWAGLRPTTPDLMPLLGETAWSNVAVAGGFHRNGILLSPFCAQLIADHMEGRLSAVDGALLDEFACSRFYRDISAHTEKPSGPRTSSMPSPVVQSPPPAAASPGPARGMAVQLPSSPPPPPPPPPASPPASPPPFYDPEADVGDSVARALAANRKFIDRQQIEPMQPPVMAADPDAIRPPAPVASAVDPSKILLWRVEDDGSRTPIRRGEPPAELLAGYGDTVLPPPLLDAASDGSDPGPRAASSPSPASQPLPSPPPTSPPPSSLPPFSPKAQPAELSERGGERGRGFWSSFFKKDAHALGVGENGASDAAAASSAASEAHDAQMASTPTSGDMAAASALHAQDAYEVISEAEVRADRSTVIDDCFKSNINLQAALADGMDADLKEAIAADIAAFQEREEELQSKRL